jgi:hypothetical protein
MRTAMLDRFISKMRALPGVWLNTCEELARYCLAHYPLSSEAAPPADAD